MVQSLGLEKVKKRRNFKNALFSIFVYTFGSISTVLIVLIILFVLNEALILISKGYLGKTVTLENIFSNVWEPVGAESSYGITPLIVGTFKVTFVALLIAVPVAILSALYSTLYASRFMKEIIKPVIELVAGLPSVVIGFFMLMVAASFLQNIFGWDFRLNAFLGGLGVAIAIIPIIFTITEDGMNAVPKHLIEAGYAMGATKFQVGINIIFPTSIITMVSAIFAGGMRAFGETMIVLMATGNSPIMNFNIFEPARTMSATIGAEMAEVVVGDEHYAMLFVIGFILLFISMIIQSMVLYMSSLYQKRTRGIK